jgi:aryl-alcohol dehydrogenase-like predicted oxidoreductase
MQRRKLGWTDLELTQVGLGTWAIGGGDWSFAWGPQDDQRSIETIHAALDQGINWIDTAPVYGLGHSEEVVGQAIAGLSERPIIATKCGRRWDAEGQIYGDLSASSIIREAEDSLRRLNIETIDLYQIHWPDPPEAIEEGWQAIGRLMDDGKIRYGGVSNFNPSQMRSVQTYHPIASLQPPYSMLKRQVEDGALSFCAEHEVSVIAYSPMQKGLLTGKVTAKWVDSLPDDDHRRHDSQFLAPELAANIELAEGLARLAEETGHTAAQLAIAWVLRRPEVTAAIVGARRPDQISETAIAGNWSPGEDAFERIDTLLAARSQTLAE